MSVNGSYPVDLFELTEDAADYLRARGAVIPSKTTSWGTVSYLVQFPGCKPSYSNRAGGNTSTRVFFPDEDTILMFSIVYGHLIQNCRVKSIQDMIVNERMLK
jgi:hypothetical protein